MKTNNTLKTIQNELKGNKTYSHTANFGDWTVYSKQDGEYDDSRYSKSYHKKFGGIFVVTLRKITFKNTKNDIEKTVYLKNWTGNFLLNAIVEAGLAPKSNVALKIRGHKAYDAVIVISEDDRIVYSRTLLGVHIDFIVVDKGTVSRTDEMLSKCAIDNNLDTVIVRTALY